jgi:hypothetical protein
MQSMLVGVGMCVGVYCSNTLRTVGTSWGEKRTVAPIFTTDA